jgi:hypothetical protein
MLSVEHELSGLGELLDECGLHEVRAEVERIVDAAWPEIKAFVVDGCPMRTTTPPAITAAADAVVAAGVPAAAPARGAGGCSSVGVMPVVGNHATTMLSSASAIAASTGRPSSDTTA